MKQLSIAVLCVVTLTVTMTRAQEAEAPRARSPAATSASASASARNGATKMKVSGVPNLHRISDRLYRAAQPTSSGMREIEKLGIRTVVSLRGFHSDRGELKGTSLRREHIIFHTWHPETEDVVRFLKLVTDTNAAPLLVHCQHGADRTGMMVAIYRIAVEDWSKDQAVAEMTRGGFGYHTIWGNLVRYIKTLDVESIRKQAGIAPAVAITASN